MLLNKNINWNADYDVIVVGFGGAGGTAARFAADNGAKTLIVEAAPYGHEGGNTRYCAQIAVFGHNLDKLTKYFNNLADPIGIRQDTLHTYLSGMINLPEYYEKYFGITPMLGKRDNDKLPKTLNLSSAEYPELEGNETIDFVLAHDRIKDGTVWKLIRKNVLTRKDMIDVWLSSRAQHLIQDPESGAIVGVVVQRNHKNYYIHANKGVVLACGGFENNTELQKEFIHTKKLTAIGTLYNRGDGIKMAAEIGAKLWHMTNYESHGVLPGYTFAEEEGHQGRQIIGWNELNHGSIFMIADDGTRFFNETAQPRHGHIYDHGKFNIPRLYDNAWLVFDEKQYEDFAKQLKNNGTLPYRPFMEKLVKAENAEKLAQKLNVPVNNLSETISTFNSYAENSKDLEFKRDPESMRAFANGNLYAIKMAPDVLNTQGGPARDGNGNILDVNDQPIPHLFGAGELGGICANRYQGAGNVAECLIFGKVSGENAANSENVASVTIAHPLPHINDLADGENMDNITLNDDQYLGSTEAGIGGKIVVRVTYKDNTIKNVEVLESHETEGIGAEVIKTLPSQIVSKNSTDIDAVSGASTTTRALEEAVNKAIKQAK